MTTEQLIAAIAASVTAGGALTELVKFLAQWASGAASREKEKSQDLISQRDRAWELVESERARADAAEAEVRRAEDARRIIAEHASTIRGLWLAKGLPPGELPPWPNN